MTPAQQHGHAAHAVARARRARTCRLDCFGHGQRELVITPLACVSRVPHAAAHLGPPERCARQAHVLVPALEAGVGAREHARTSARAVVLGCTDQTRRCDDRPYTVYPGARRRACRWPLKWKPSAAGAWSAQVTDLRARLPACAARCAPHALTGRCPRQPCARRSAPAALFRAKPAHTRLHTAASSSDARHIFVNRACRQYARGAAWTPDTCCTAGSSGRLRTSLGLPWAPHWPRAPGWGHRVGRRTAGWAGAAGCAPPALAFFFFAGCGSSSSSSPSPASADHLQQARRWGGARGDVGCVLSRVRAASEAVHKRADALALQCTTGTGHRHERAVIRWLSGIFGVWSSPAAPKVNTMQRDKSNSIPLEDSPGSRGRAPVAQLRNTNCQATGDQQPEKLNQGARARIPLPQPLCPNCPTPQPPRIPKVRARDLLVGCGGASWAGGASAGGASAAPSSISTSMMPCSSGATCLSLGLGHHTPLELHGGTAHALSKRSACSDVQGDGAGAPGRLLRQRGRRLLHERACTRAAASAACAGACTVGHQGGRAAP